MFRELETQRCLLRPFKDKDLTIFTAYRDNPNVARYQSWTNFSYAEALALYQGMQEQGFGLAGIWYQIAIADRHTDKLLGDLALCLVGPDMAEVGFTIDPLHQGRGYGREGLNALLGYLFDTQGHLTVRAVTDVRNLASIRLLESVGFKQQGQARQVIFKGEPAQEYLYGCNCWAWLAAAR